MEKYKISVFCKSIRNNTGLTIDQFAKNHNVTRQYISRIENGKYDKPSIAQLSTIFKTYDLTPDDLYSIDVDEIIVQGVEFVTNFRSPYSFLKNAKSNLELLKQYLESNSYTALYDSSQIDMPYDLTAITPEGDKMICHVLGAFSTGLSDKQREQNIYKNTCSFVEKVFKNEQFFENKKTELIILTSSHKSFDVFKKYSERHFFGHFNCFITLKVVFVYPRRKAEELIIF